MALTTLLQAAEWERALHFYYHSLYQRDLPGTVTTGYLVQALGKAKKWAAALQVYELCVKLLHAQRQMRLKSDPNANETPSRTWGTTLSMAMTAVQCCPTAPSTALLTMLQQLENGKESNGQSSSLPPVVQLDGNFISAVEALEQENDRVAVLRYAKREGLLDTFKLIRELLSKHKWEQALMLFAEAMETTTTLSSLSPLSTENTAASTASTTAKGRKDCRSVARLSRREIGETRLNFLHSSTIHAVSTVVEVLNRHRNEKGRRGVAQMGSVVTTDAWRLNDQEVECVLSKTLEATETAAAVSTRVAAFWQYCLQVLEYNYGTRSTTPFTKKDIPTIDVETQHSEAAMPLRSAPQTPSTSSARQRRPTISALSFLLRHPRLPWQVALQLVEAYDLLNASHDSETVHPQGRRGRSATHNVGRDDRGSTNMHVTPRALALNAAMRRLSSQGQHKAAEELALRALDAEVSEQRHSRSGVSLSSNLLQLVSFRTLQEVLLKRRREGLYVEKRVLFHVLRESVSAGERRNQEMLGKGSAAQLSEESSDSRPFVDHPCGRALTVVHLLMQRAVLSSGSSAAVATQALQQLPASLFKLETPSSKSAGSLLKTQGMSPPVSWLLAYPPAVHCEVIRVIRSMTVPAPRIATFDWCTGSNSDGKESRECDVLRWTWTMRYLRALTDYFAGQKHSAPDPSHCTERNFSFLSTRGYSEIEKARETYYVSTFEAVLSLLETNTEREVSRFTNPSVSVQGSGTAFSTTEWMKEESWESEKDEVPRSSKQRVQVVCQLLERAITRYDCVPPTHMFLPNQLDRLLPPLVKRKALQNEDNDNLRNSRGHTDDLEDSKVEERCAAAACLVQLVLRSLDRGSSASHTTTGAPRTLRAVEPALLHNTLKLCCRVAEYRRELSHTPRDTALSVTADNIALCATGAALVRLQCERCGLRTVRPGTLSLLYHLCAAVEASASPAHTSLPKKVALETTEYLLERQTSYRHNPSYNIQRQGRSDPPAILCHAGESGPRQRSHSAETGDQWKEEGVHEYRASVVAVQPYHCELFFSLFGWENTLHVWYPVFPREVLRQLAGDPLAVETCLNLEEQAKK